MLTKNINFINYAIDTLFNYLHDVIFDPANAALDIEKLPFNFQNLGRGLKFFAECFIEGKMLAQALSRGDLTEKLPSRTNELASPLKSLHASLKHLTWQTQQIAKGDYNQRVEFMGEFSDAFNMMVKQLAERQEKLEQQAYHDYTTKLYNRTFGMFTLDRLLYEKKCFVLIFADLDGLKHINDEFGHNDGDKYITNAAKHLSTFSSDAIVCRIGGDEFMLLVQDVSYGEAQTAMSRIYRDLQNDEYLRDKKYSYSISYGVIAIDKENLLSSSDILSIADERMYEDKRRKKKSIQKTKNSS
jgi:diguanylate cyclase (GGDEF)-like protein